MIMLMTMMITIVISFFKRNKKLEAKDVSPNTNHMQATGKADKCFFVPGDLDLQTRLSERPNTSSV